METFFWPFAVNPNQTCEGQPRRPPFRLFRPNPFLLGPRLIRFLKIDLPSRPKAPPTNGAATLAAAKAGTANAPAATDGTIAGKNNGGGGSRGGGSRSGVRSGSSGSSGAVVPGSVIVGVGGGVVGKGVSNPEIKEDAAEMPADTAEVIPGRMASGGGRFNPKTAPEMASIGNCGTALTGLIPTLNKDNDDSRIKCRRTINIMFLKKFSNV